jgi:hypothetical protein
MSKRRGTFRRRSITLDQRNIIMSVIEVGAVLIRGISTTSPHPAITGSPFRERMYATIVGEKIEGPRLGASLAIRPAYR